MIPLAMNRNVRFKTGVGPLLDAMDKPDDIDSSCLDGLSQKLAPVGQALTLTRTALPAETTLIGFAGAPWTLITYIWPKAAHRAIFPKRGNGHGKINKPWMGY